MAKSAVVERVRVRCFDEWVQAKCAIQNTRHVYMGEQRLVCAAHLFHCVLKIGVDDVIHSTVYK